MTDTQWNALKEMTRGMVFECDMSLGKVRLEPQGLYSYVLRYPNKDVLLHKDEYVSTVDKLYLRKMYSEWLLRRLRKSKNPIGSMSMD